MQQNSWHIGIVKAYEMQQAVDIKLLVCYNGITMEKRKCSVCGKEWYEDSRSLAGWTRIILNEKCYCSKECRDKDKQDKGG